MSLIHISLQLRLLHQHTTCENDTNKKTSLLYASSILEIIFVTSAFGTKRTDVKLMSAMSDKRTFISRQKQEDF